MDVPQWPVFVCITSATLFLDSSGICFNVVGASAAAYDDNEIMEKLEGLTQATPADGV